MSYGLECLLPLMFADRSRPSMEDHKIRLEFGGKEVDVDSFQYVTDLYDMRYERRWRDVAILVGFCGGMQLFHVYATRFKAHIDR